jgi:hypothetical protein
LIFKEIAVPRGKTGDAGSTAELWPGAGQDLPDMDSGHTMSVCRILPARPDESANVEVD